MKIKNILFTLIVLLQLNIGFTQCNIYYVNNFSYYAQGTSNGLIYQSAISLPSIYGNPCNVIFASPLTTPDLSTATFDAGPLKQIIVFPNPVESFLNISWKGVDMNCMIEISNTLGLKLQSYHRDKRESSSRIDVQALSPGCYILVVSNINQQYQYSIKLLKI